MDKVLQDVLDNTSGLNPQEERLMQKQYEILNRELVYTESGKAFTGRELLRMIGDIEAKNTATVTGKWKKFKRLLPGHHKSVYSNQLVKILKPFGLSESPEIYQILPALRELQKLKLISIYDIFRWEAETTMLWRWTTSPYSIKLKPDAKKLLQSEA